MEKETKIISAFNGTGKTYIYENRFGKDIIDLDKDDFDVRWFDELFSEYVKEHIGKVDIILVGSEQEVLNSLTSNMIPFTLVYPDKSLKEEYMERFRKMGYSQTDLNLINDNWDTLIHHLNSQGNCKKIKLNKGDYLESCINNI